jgi:hypothetical protein
MWANLASDNGVVHGVVVVAVVVAVVDRVAWTAFVVRRSLVVVVRRNIAAAVNLNQKLQFKSAWWHKNKEAL